jgi:NADH-quinone oxidoreductase subunit J
MSAWFAVIAGLTLVSAWAAMTLRNLVHCALALALAFTGIGATYLFLDAQFLGLAQLLVYVGAIAVLIVFVILLTRGDHSDAPQRSKSTAVGIVLAVCMFGVLAWALLHSFALRPGKQSDPSLSVRQLGTQMMGGYILPLEVIGLMLTAALIGAAIVAMKEKQGTR